MRFYDSLLPRVMRMNLLNFYEFVRNIVADFIEITNKLCTTLPCLSKLLATSAHADGKKGLISYEPIRDFKVLQRLKSSQFLSEYPTSGCQRQNKSFCENWNGKILLTDSSLLAKSLHSAGENNRAASKKVITKMTEKVVHNFLTSNTGIL